MKILLVEDAKKIATIVKRDLEAKGFTVEIAFAGPVSSKSLNAVPSGS